MPVTSAFWPLSGLSRSAGGKNTLLRRLTLLSLILSLRADISYLIGPDRSHRTLIRSLLRPPTSRPAPRQANPEDVIKKYVAADSAERAEWQKESAEDAVWDAEWNKRHGRLPARGTKRHPSARRGVSAGRRRRFALCLRHYTGSFSAFRSRADIERDLVSGPRFVILITIPVCTQITNTIETSSTAGY